MKPGIPWSVKGIEQQARAAAKQAARQSGMTIGEWLNTVILDSADGGDDLERRYRRPPYRPKPLPGAGHDEGEQVTLRLEEIAEQLHTIARHESDTALSRHTSPEDESRLRAIVERLDAYEQHTSAAIGAMQERLEEVSERLVRQPGHEGPQRADEVPGYRALEGALRNIIEHIEVSETRTRDSIRSLQERLVETMDQSGSEPASAAAVGELEQRVAELAERLAGAEVTEQRLRGLVEEAKLASGPIDPGAHLKLQGEIDSLNQRFDDMRADAVSERDIDRLRLEIEQLATTVSHASDYALTDLGSRVEQLEVDLKSQSSARDNGTSSEVTALAERIAATEKRLDHLATIEQSVGQLARSLETDRSDASHGSGRAPGNSPELKALEDGLKAVRASAEFADRRTQETLHAVHETLEHIVAKLAELEADGGPDEEESGEQPDGEIAQEAAQEFAEELDEQVVETEFGEELGEELAKEPIEDDASSLDAEPESAVAPAENEADDTPAMETATQGGFADLTPEETDSDSREEPRMETPGVASDAYAAAPPAGEPVREDYIAAARRAAQMAATRSQNPVTSGFNKFSQRMSGAGRKTASPAEGRAQKRGFVSSLLAGLRGRKAKPDEEAQPDNKKTKRKRLIFAGLVLLAAVSAYGAHHASVPGFNLLGGALVGPEAGPASSKPEARTGLRPHDTITTASIAPLSRAAAERRTVVSDMLPLAIGPQSLRQAAIGGDATAQFIVANRFLEGKAVTRDEEQAAQWYRRAAKQGLAAAQYRLGSMYEHGRGMPLDRKEARVWYEQAAEGGNISAMHNLAVLYTDAGTGKRYYELAANWFRRAAERGLKDSQFNLAVLNEQGVGVPRSPQDSVFWYSLAAVHGDSEAAARAKALEASLPPEMAKQVHARLLAWRALDADPDANAVTVGEPSWQETS